MADDDRNDDENIVSTTKRFEIYVPSPKARINFGVPSKDPENGPFGYTGLSLQSDVHMFVDVNKDLQLQATHVHTQAGGKWLQYASEDMVLSSTANVNLSADKKIVIASGSGQGSVGASDHGNNPRLLSYNALKLHYNVDRLQVGLFEFFHGRHERQKHWITESYFDRAKSTPTLTDASLKGGFVAMAAKSLRELYPVANERAISDHKSDVNEPGDPVALLDPLVEKKILGGKSAASALEWGFSAYFKRFDPYAKNNPADADGALAYGFTKFKNLLASMRRFADVAARYAWILSDNFIGKHAQAAMAAVDNLAKATSKAYAVVDLTFGTFGGWGGMGAEFADERDSGVASRPKSVSDNSRGAARVAARVKVLEKYKASITSGTGPFDLTAHDAAAWTITIEAGSPATTKTVTFAEAAATPAVLEVTASLDDQTLPRLNVRVFRPTGLDPSVTDAMLVAAVGEVFGAELQRTTAMSTTGQTVSVSRSVVQNLTRYDVTSTDTRSLRNQVMQWELPGGSTAIAVISTATTLSLVTRPQDIALDIAGTSVTVTLAPPGSAFVSADAEQTYVHDTFASAIGSAATVSDPGETFTITTSQTGASAQIRVERGASVTLRGLGLRPSQVVRGTDATGGLVGVNRSAVTAQQLADVIGAGSGYQLAVVDGALRLSSTSSPKPDGDSYVTVSGNLADAIFSTKTNRETYAAHEDETAANDAAAASDFKTLLLWNNELQKLPEDTRNLMRPLTSAIYATVASFSALEAATESMVEIVSGEKKGLPEPPEAIGLLAKEGITLGTQDRIVGAGGKGIVFIVDGGSGDEDHQKFVKTEAFLNRALEWDPIDDYFHKDKKETTVPSVGFRVLAAPSVDLFGTFGAELAALGRGKLTSALPDGSDYIGLGVARLAGSYAAEVTGHRKVVISARNAGKDSKHGGRVELAAQTIAIGGMNVDNDVQDFKAAGGFGIEPLSVKDLAGAEHLNDDQQNALKKQLDAYTWSQTLREGKDKRHPSTQQVLVHAAKETIIQVGTFLVHVDATKGVSVVTRKPDPDPTKNEPDTTKPSLSIDGTKIVASSADGKDGVKLELTGKTLTIKAAEKTTLTIDEAGLKGTGGKSFIMQGDDVKIDGTKTYRVSGRDVAYKFSGTFKIG